MSVRDYLLVGFGSVFAGFFVVHVLEMRDQRLVARCVGTLDEFICPKCHKALGRAAKSSARQQMIKFTAGFGKRLRGRDYPSRLVVTTCPHCLVELRFRLDGSLFSCNHEVLL
jgi:hypothetical protein